ncbi:uncharacterized protein KY384_000839 [Bacidia gigantensis]|uniref:uncharacterized protein n=1 Tax=Bacidia gigantensis TaxID=2732470 RepID=UPI001D042C92|nr:uncharacterized protein KY384_000839 [Bacidia gigantensis]KAG8533997.1 hypothetical protein KY384_000839 [Bacidia gigantensis]
MSAEEEGATPRELLLESCRRNNASLLTSLLTPSSPQSHPSLASPPQRAHFLNTTTDGIGQCALHVAALNGSCEVLDVLLDQDGLEVDPIDKIEGDTPLHKAVRYGNDGNDEGGALAMVEMLVDAGADIRIRNKGKLKPIDLVERHVPKVKEVLQKAEVALMVADEVAVDSKEEDEGPAGSASDSD